ncbi:unnamed protein product [Paramecium pentaurelia]|uniref:Uncharacterized protein n=1 Tax=Paramecium pentaurelia TaxID=43138 RepID=A0A8S1YLK0_9CILI|nr:unnamed protein product [Paramecium pentaurelia]
MSNKLFILIGNDEQLKNQLYYQLTGIRQLYEEVNYKIYPSPIKDALLIQEKNIYVLNTPPIETQEDHIRLWSLIAAICQCQKLIIEDVFYCLDNSNQLIIDILNYLTYLFYYNNKNGIYFFTKKSIDVLNQISSKTQNQICFQFRYTDFIQKFKQLIRRQNKMFFRTYCFENLKINEQSEIQHLINEISNEYIRISIYCNNYAQFIINFFKNEHLEKTINSFKFEFDNIQSIFEYRVLIKQSLNKLFNQILKYFSRLTPSSFYQCLDCLQICYIEKSINYPIDPIRSQTQIANPNDRQSTLQCKHCQYLLTYTSPYLIIQACLDDLELRIFEKFQFEFENQPIYRVKTKTEPLQKKQKSNPNIKIIEIENLKLKDATQILFLSNEDNYKSIIFNTLIEYRDQEQININNNIFINGQITDGNNSYVLHNPPLFDFQITNLDAITSFKQYFSKITIHHFVFFVNYQRTDIMKQRFFEMFKKLLRLNKSQVSIIVTQCNSDVDQLQDLKSELEKFTLNSIIFLNKQINQTQIKQQILECFQKVIPIQFQFQGTIFEEDNVEEEKQIENNLNIAVDQIENDKMEELQIQFLNNDNQIQELKQDIEQQEKLLKQKKEKLRDLIQENETNKQIIQKWYYKRQQQKALYQNQK